MRINQNISAMNTHASMVKADNSMSKSLERLSSGYRINRAADDAAGLAISEKMRGQISGLKQASKNAQDGISLLQTAEGNLNESHSILQRMRELADQAANGTVTDSDRAEIQKEMNQLTKEVDRIAKDTEFNTMKLLRGKKDAVSLSGTVTASSGGVFTSAMTGGAVAAKASGSITFDRQLAVGDKISVNDKEYTMVAAGTTATATQITLGSSLSGTLTNIQAKLADATNGVVSGATGVASGEGIAATVSGNALKLTAQINGVAGNVAVEATLSAASQASDHITLTMQIGANAGQSMDADINNMDAGSLGIGRDANGAAVKGGTDAVQGLDVTSSTTASNALTAIDDAINKVSSERSKLGAYQNRLDHTVSNLSTAAENLSASESRIRDVDMADEMSNFSRAQILMQASTAMMAQANQKPQAVLKLLG